MSIPKSLAWASHAFATERADEILNGVKPFSNATDYWPGVDQLVDAIERTLPQITTFAESFAAKFGDEDEMRFIEVAKSQTRTNEFGLFWPDNHETLRGLVLLSADTIRRCLETLADIPPDVSDSNARLRGVVLLAAETAHEWLSELRYEAEGLAEQHIESIAFDAW